MKVILNRWCVALGLWLAGLGGWTSPVCSRPHLPDDEPVLADARWVIAEVAGKFGAQPGEWKRRQALLMLMQRHPETAERALNLAIELALL